MSLEVAIRKRFGDAFSLDVEFRTSGSLLGILGASGCGKSMTLKCIAGIEHPDSGRIILDGRVLFDSSRGINLKPQERRVGYLFQNYALFPTMTIRQNIISGMSGPRARKCADADALLPEFHLDGLGDRYPDELSGGQQQRAALARMLAPKPDVILLDEPLSALDSHLRERMQQQLAEVAGKVGEAVMVTHSRDEVYKICPELLVMAGGRVIAAGATRDIFVDPGFLTVAELTGCKNISRISRLGANRVMALDWGIELAVQRTISAGDTHIAVRAHDMQPFSECDSGADNVFAMRVLDKIEDPFEWNIHFITDTGSERSSGQLWWKVSKYLMSDLPQHIVIPPAAVIPLRNR